jgi:hypothetical protein
MGARPATYPRKNSVVKKSQPKNVGWINGQRPPLSRIEEDGRNWLRRPKFCIKSCRAIIIIIIRYDA